jgi:4-amino-4-deoxy-L-arabinose transferase-like glycosyltransferase
LGYGERGASLCFCSEEAVVRYWSQTFAAILLGTPLAFAVGGLYAQFGPSDPATNYIAAVMLLLPVWLGIMLWTLKRQKARSAWLVLGALNLCMLCMIVLSRLVLGGHKS